MSDFVASVETGTLLTKQNPYLYWTLVSLYTNQYVIFLFWGEGGGVLRSLPSIMPHPHPTP